MRPASRLMLARLASAGRQLRGSVAHLASGLIIKRSLQRLIIMYHRRLIAAKNRMRLRARVEADLDAASRREVLPSNDIEHKLHVLAPVGELLLRAWRPRNIKRELHHCAVDAGIKREDPCELDVITLQHQDRVGEQRVDERRVPHQVPGLFGLGLEPPELLSRKGEPMVETESLEVTNVAVQDGFK